MPEKPSASHASTAATAVDTGPFDPVSMIATSDFLTFPPDTPAAAVISRLVAQDDAAPDHACVADAQGRFLGLVSLRDCLRGAPDRLLGSFMKPAGEHAEPDWSAEEASFAVAEDPVCCLPVIDAAGRAIGIVTVQAAQTYLAAECDRDADRFVGLVGSDQGDEYLDLSVWQDFRRRFPWVLGLAVVGLAAGYVVHVFEDALDALVILALYMPMVADTGGNVGTQSASLVTRAISTGEVRVADALRILWREARVALMMAGALFVFAFLKVLLISNAGDVPAGLDLSSIGIAIALALAAQVISATLIGAVLPVASVALRQDPAVVSGPALTTIVDLTGLILYFTITTWVLGLT